MENTLASLAIESWRLSKSFERLLIKSDPMEQRKYKSKLSWFNKKLNETLEEANLKFINLENQKYDTGAAVTAINLDDFQPDDDLEIDQMIEPIIMSNEGVFRAGTVVLRKRSSL